MRITRYLLLALSLMSGWVSAQNVSMITMNWPPFYGSELEDKGFISVLVAEAFKASGYESELTISSWQESLDKVQAGEVDAVMGAYFSEERAKIYHYSIPIFTAQTGMIKKKGFPLDLYTSYEMLDQYKLGKLKNGVIGETFDNYGFQQMQEFEAVAPALQALSNGEIDLYADNLAVVRHTAKDLGMDPSSLELVQPPIAENDLYLMISKDIPNALEVRDAFNAGLIAIQANGTYADILMRFNQM